jgi:acetoin utilization deacetylase AcuC-like enzyme
MAAVIDLDVHQGNGTAAIFAGDPRVFTLSVHEEDNYPYVKPCSSLDLGLARGAGDAEYLGVLEGALTRALGTMPDLVVYLAGADPYADDQLGGLALTRDGLRRRDRMVFEAARGVGVPIVVLLAGGYARHFEDTVAIHAATVEEAARF